MESKKEGWQWWAASIVGVATLAFVAPHQLSVLLWIMTQMAVGAVSGYWIDRALFPNAKVGDLSGDEGRHARYRRALLIASGMMSVTVGL